MADADERALKKEHAVPRQDDLTLTKPESLEDVDYADMNDLQFYPSDNDDPVHLHNNAIIANTTPTTDLERALAAELDRQVQHNALLAGECAKLRIFISKRKQTYKRKRKDESAPRKKLSGYNLFVRERFAKIARANEEALRSADSGAELKRIPPASNIVEAGHAWNQLSAEEKARYNELAKPDEDRYEKEAADYTRLPRGSPSEKVKEKRNKTGYNLFYSQNVHEIKMIHGAGATSGSGSTARIVADAWNKLLPKEKDAYEKQAVEEKKMKATQQNHRNVAELPLPLPPLHCPHLMHAMAAPPPDGIMPSPEQLHPSPPMVELLHGGALPPPGEPGGPLDWPPDYGMHPPPPPVIHQPTGYEPYYQSYDPYGYAPSFQGPPPPYQPGVALLPGYGPPPVNYRGPPPPYA